MLTKAVRLYGKDDLRLEEFELPEITDDEILASVVTDSLCMSTWKEAKQGPNHKKVPDNLEENPIIIGHEFCGEILKVGKNWAHQFKEGNKFAIQANLQLKDRPDCPGYSFPFVGGDATYIVIPKEVMEQDCLLEYNGDTFFEGSLLEPLSCVIAGFNANYHLIEGTYDHQMGIKDHGNMMIMGGTGPMGYLAVDYALHGPKKPKTLVVTGVNDKQITAISKLYTKEEAKKAGVDLHFVNVSRLSDQKQSLLQIVNNEFYDDVFVFVPNKDVAKMGSALLAKDGCLNFFAGPSDNEFSVEINFYDIHYSFTHYVGTSGGNTEHMREAIRLVEEKKVHAAKIVSHILGLDQVIDTTLNLPDIKGGKKLTYTHKKMELKSLRDIQQQDQPVAFYNDLKAILNKTNGVWSKEAEQYILEHAEEI